MFARILASLLWLLPTISTLFAQKPQYEAITIEHGLSQGMIFDIVQTRDGFIWVATKDALNRYDGYNFKVFSNDPFDPFSIAENTVTALFEDSRGWLWLGTESKGIDLYDRHSGRFHHFSLDFKRLDQAASFDVYAIREAPDGSICLLQKSNGLIRIAIPAAWAGQLPNEPDLSRLTQATCFTMEPSKPAEGDMEEYLIAINAEPGGDLRAYSNLRAYTLDSEQALLRPIAAGKANDPWLTFPFRLIRFLDGQADLPEFPPNLKTDWFMVKPAGNGVTWLGINKQLWHLSPGKKIDLSKPDWSLDANITAVETDRNGNIWVGTLGYGLRKLNPRKQAFHTGATGSSIWGLWRDTRGRYFCKIINAIFPYDPVTGKIGTERAFPETSRRLLDMWIEPKGPIWLLGRGDQENGMAELWHHDPQNGVSRGYPFRLASYVYARIFRSSQGHIWITGLNCQLIRFTPQSARFEQFDYTALFGKNAGTVRAFACAEDGNGTIWIGTQRGLVKCIPNGQSYDFELLQANPAKPNGLNNNSIACLLPDPTDPKGILWIGTKGGGINRLDLQSGLIQHITTRDGLPDNVIYGILPGNKDELWCSTNRGLAKLKPNGTGRPFGVTAFTAAQGLQDNEFNTQAFFKATNGELLFGGVNGLNHFFSDAVLPDTTPPPVFIIGLQINHQDATFGNPGSPLDKPLEFLKTLRLNHEQNNISFEFAALDFTDPAKNRYRYRLVGADPDWVETGTLRFAHFTHLSPGRYTLLVQGNNGEGAWQDASNPISITILPPWWRTKAAYTVYILLLLWGGWQAYRFQMRRVQLREQLAYEHRETIRMKALEQMKTNFFSNVTHEFRTPLTLILGPARQILNDPKDPSWLDKVRLIEKNGLQLQGLVNQLLDMAKLEAGLMALELRRGDLGQTIRDVFESFLPLAEKRGVKLTLKQDWHGSPVFEYDAGKVQLVLNNLISNALKFTPAGGRVDITVGRVGVNEVGIPNITVSPSPPTIIDHSSFIIIKVSDTGIGIPPEALDKVFDRFYQVDGSHTRSNEGTGIGLALSKEMAELLGGSILVESEVGKGATFTFWMPVSDLGAEQNDNKADKSDAPAVWAPAQLPAAPAPRPQGTAPIALVIEDNAELRHFIKQSIGAVWQVMEAADGEEGLKKAIELLPDIVISDVMMPRKDGYAVCDELKNNELTAHIPVILLTAKSGLDAKIQGLRRGADDYLTKPFHTEELVARMENLVEARRRLHEHYMQWSARAHSSETGSGEAPLPESDRMFLKKMALLIETRLDEEGLSVETLAEAMFVSRSQLHRKLVALTGQSPTDFVREHRLARAYSMLQNREGNVTQVSDRCGFGNEKYFSRVFKEKYGFPPSKMF
jgi:signal transduction histidine kinase/DNA-binding response OmpR family regulator/ligand-binding sensor domain-containing protein